jgi:quinohemoprotein ethanol dehydrogenase
VLPITDLFAGAATRSGRAPASGLVFASALVWVCTLAAARAQPPAAPSAPVNAAAVDAARLKAADSEPQNWFTGGRDQSGSYYSPLADIDAGNVKKLGYAWSYDLGNPQRGQEATPIVVDGVMYTSGTWGYVYAVDAASGRERWRYDPKGDWFPARNPCCDLVNRGVAVWKGKVYVASGDGRLHAIDAATGKPVWVVDTIIDHKLPYASTGAPQIARDVVIIGNGGSDMGHGLRPIERRLQMAVLHRAAGPRPCARQCGSRGRGQDLESAARSAVQGRRHRMGRLRL